LAACRPELGVDPIIFLPMSVYARSRLLRWRMGWLPARPVRCSQCDAEHASRNHLIGCLDVARRLGLPKTYHHPLDTILNYLPLKQAKTKPLQIQEYLFWKDRWPAILFFLLKVDEICH
ncbi:hypothetical protein K501DRAFT_157304, partial [Backusella circina FSU 941]